MHALPAESPEAGTGVARRIAGLAARRPVRIAVGASATFAAWFMPEGWIQEGLMTLGVAALALSIGDDWAWKVLVGLGVVFLSFSIVLIGAGPFAIPGLLIGPLLLGRGIHLRGKIEE